MSPALIQLEDFSARSPERMEAARPVLDRLKSFEPGAAVREEMVLPSLSAGEQYRFHIDLRRCIGCRCCEVACNEQNNNPPTVKWRRVGEIEGGSYPHTHRLHISMSCNHCLEPSCLEGCPVDAYEKLPNGIVKHHADTCIGCQYCTWNCPYGVPQYHEERHIVTKCHLCVDRLEAGALPACVEACPTRAIEVEAVNVADWRQAIAEGNAPGVPPADLTFSTTRITVPEGLPQDMGKSEPWQLEPEAPHWPLVFLLVLVQWSVGLFALVLGGGLFGAATPTMLHWGALGAFVLGQIALAASAFHLGRPIHALRAVRAWRRSWLSREALSFLIFGAMGIVPAAAAALDAFGFSTTSSESRLVQLLLGLTTLAGAAGVVSGIGIYRIPARPAWDTWRTPVQFSLTAALLASLSGLVVIAAAGWSDGAVTRGRAATVFLGAVAALSAILQAALPWTLVASGLAGDSASLRSTAILLTRRFPRCLWLRTLLPIIAAGAAVLAGTSSSQARALSFAVAAIVAAFAGEIIGRFLFFVTVVPRNMPGSFFGRNAPGGH